MYSKTKKGTIAFDGQTVAYELARLKVEDARAFREGGAAKVDEVLRKSIVSLGAFKDADGADVALESVLTEFYFSPLVNELVKALMETGGIPQDRVGPSDASLPAGSQVDATR